MYWDLSGVVVLEELLMMIYHMYINRKQSAKVERIGKSYVHWVGEGQRHCAHAESHLRVVLIILVKFLTLSAKLMMVFLLLLLYEFAIVA